MSIGVVDVELEFLSTPQNADLASLDEARMMNVLRKAELENKLSPQQLEELAVTFNYVWALRDVAMRSSGLTPEEVKDWREKVEGFFGMRDVSTSLFEAD